MKSIMNLIQKVIQLFPIPFGQLLITLIVYATNNKSATFLVSLADLLLIFAYILYAFMKYINNKSNNVIKDYKEVNDKNLADKEATISHLQKQLQIERPKPNEPYTPIV